MNERDDGPNAFPVWTVESAMSGGMSLRDYFAGQALAGMSAHPNIGEVSSEKLAHWAYDQADAMLAERRKP